MELVIAYNAEKDYILRKYTIANESLLYNVSVDETVQQTDAENANDSPVEQVADAPAPRKRLPPRDKLVPLRGIKIYYICAAALFGMFAVVLGVLVFFSFLTARQTVFSFAKAFAFLLLGGFAIYLFGVAFCANRRYKRMLRTPLTYTAGKLVCSLKRHGDGGRRQYACEYTDADGKKQSIRVSHFLVDNMVKNGNTNVVVAYNQKECIVLTDKTKFPAVLRLR